MHVNCRGSESPRRARFAVRGLVALVALLLWSAPAAAREEVRQAAWTALQDAVWIQQGDGKRIVYVFTDMNCPYCADLYRTLKPMVVDWDLQLRWVPVAVVSATSAGKAAAVLQAGEPLAMVDQSKQHFERGRGGAIAEDIPSPETEAALRDNLALLDQVAVPVVPTLLLRTREGEAAIFQGALSPLALSRIFRRLLGEPE